MGRAPVCGELEIFANQKNRVVVTGTGNEADKRHHYQGETRVQEERGTGGTPRRTRSAGISGGNLDRHSGCDGGFFVFPLRGNRSRKYPFGRTAGMNTGFCWNRRPLSSIIAFGGADQFGADYSEISESGQKGSGRSDWNRCKVLREHFISGFRCREFLTGGGVFPAPKPG